MDIIKEIKEILTLQGLGEIERSLSLLNDELEYCRDLDKVDIADGAKLLLTAALQENNQMVRTKFFRTIDKAVIHHNISAYVNWDRLVARLTSLGKWELEYVLDILGISGQAGYLPALEEYAHHTDPEIREWAQEAIDEIEYQIEHTSASHREAV